jgi:hypothetical protein
MREFDTNDSNTSKLESRITVTIDEPEAKLNAEGEIQLNSTFEKISHFLDFLTQLKIPASKDSGSGKPTTQTLKDQATRTALNLPPEAKKEVITAVKHLFLGDRVVNEPELTQQVKRPQNSSKNTPAIDPTTIDKQEDAPTTKSFFDKQNEEEKERERLEKERERWKGLINVNHTNEVDIGQLGAIIATGALALGIALTTPFGGGLILGGLFLWAIKEVFNTTPIARNSNYSNSGSYHPEVDFGDQIFKGILDQYNKQNNFPIPPNPMEEFNNDNNKDLKKLFISLENDHNNLARKGNLAEEEKKLIALITERIPEAHKKAQKENPNIFLHETDQKKIDREKEVVSEILKENGSLNESTSKEQKIELIKKYYGKYRQSIRSIEQKTATQENYHASEL